MESPGPKKFFSATNDAADKECDAGQTRQSKLNFARERHEQSNAFGRLTDLQIVGSFRDNSVAGKLKRVQFKKMIYKLIKLKWLNNKTYLRNISRTTLKM